MINCTVNIIYYMLCIEFEIVFYIWYIGQKLHDWSEINTYFWFIEKQAWADTKIIWKKAGAELYQAS